VTKFGLLVGKNNAGIIFQEKHAVEDIAAMGGWAGEGWWIGLQTHPHIFNVSCHVSNLMFNAI
jgi:hypothetical protein